jgi:hypothetical protein
MKNKKKANIADFDAFLHGDMRVVLIECAWRKWRKYWRKTMRQKLAQRSEKPLRQKLAQRVIMTDVV